MVLSLLWRATITETYDTAPSSLSVPDELTGAGASTIRSESTTADKPNPIAELK